MGSVLGVKDRKRGVRNVHSLRVVKHMVRIGWAEGDGVNMAGGSG